MINITNKQNCCGCSACATICPKRCITMAADNEGFLYPQVNKNICIDCGLCEKVCNELHPFDKRKPLKTLAIINNNGGSDSSLLQEVYFTSLPRKPSTKEELYLALVSIRIDK